MISIQDLLKELNQIIEMKSKQSSIEGMNWEDVAQELRIEVWKKQKHFHNGKSSHKTFANLIFRNKIIDLYRKHNRLSISFYEDCAVWEYSSEKLTF